MTLLMAGGGPGGRPGYGRLLYVTHGSVGGVVETHLETKKVRTAPTQLLWGRGTGNGPLLPDPRQRK